MNRPEPIPARPPARIDVARIDALDALRGIAALFVVTYHCSMAVPGLRDRLAATVVLMPLVLGPSAVLVFFALSGFVLYLSFDASDRFRYAPYIVKRFARIYPPLAAAILVSAGLYLLLTPQPVERLSGWFNHSSWENYPTLTIVLGHLALLDGRTFQGLDNVVWSLVHEMRISVVFPLVALAVRRNWRVACLATLGLALVARRYDALLAGSPFDVLASLQYVFLFAAGATLASKAERIKAWGESPSGCRIGGALLVGGSIALSGGLTRSTIAMSLGAVALVAACFAHPPTRRFLSLSPLIWLGRVSYSLYLIHLLVMLVLVHGLHRWIAAPVLVLLVTPFSLLLAEPAYRYVERPSIAFGRKLARSFPARSDRPARKARGKAHRIDPQASGPASESAEA